MSEDRDFGARLLEAFKTDKATSRYRLSHVPELSNQPYAMIQRIKTADRKETAEIFKNSLPSLCDWNVYVLISRDGTPEDVVECIVMNQRARSSSLQPYFPIMILLYSSFLLMLMSNLIR